MVLRTCQIFGECMNVQQRDKIIVLTKKNYELLGCVFPEDTYELVEYLSESQHGDELRCLESAIQAHNLYNNDRIDQPEFFEWHGL